MQWVGGAGRERTPDGQTPHEDHASCLRVAWLWSHGKNVVRPLHFSNSLPQGAVLSLLCLSQGRVISTALRMLYFTSWTLPPTETYQR